MESRTKSRKDTNRRSPLSSPAPFCGHFPAPMSGPKEAGTGVSADASYLSPRRHALPTPAGQVPGVGGWAARGYVWPASISASTVTSGGVESYITAAEVLTHRLSNVPERASQLETQVKSFQTTVFRGYSGRFIATFEGTNPLLGTGWITGSPGWRRGRESL